MSKFLDVGCSQCGRSFGPGDHGFSHCHDHAPFRDGNIYFWRWKDEATDRAHYAYHCRSRKAEVRRGLLFDTYWCDMSPERAIDPAKCTLEYQGNLDELREIRPYEAPYYRPEDVVDMRHENFTTACVYIRPGAERSQPHILEHLAEKHREARSKLYSAESQMERINQAITEVTGGKLDGYLP